MKRDDVRLELLKLTYTHGRDSAEAVSRAKVLEAYVLEEAQDGASAEEGKPPPKGRKKVGNPDPLS